MAQYKREFVEPASPDELLLSQRTYRQGSHIFIFGLKTNAYDFRRSVSSTTDYVTTYVDDDSSGDYDPHQEKKLKYRQVGPRRRKNAHLDSNQKELQSSGTSPKTSTWLPDYRAIFKFHTEVGKQMLKCIGTETHQNWPDAVDKEESEANFTEISIKSIQERKLQEKKALQNQDREGGVPTLAEVPHSHPSSEGCIQCQQDEVECTLLKEPETYPCRHCQFLKHECEMIIPPRLKDGCLHCRKARIICSYRKSDDNHDAPCEKCQKEGMRCLAGPKIRPLGQGPIYLSYDKNTVKTSALVKKKVGAYVKPNIKVKNNSMVGRNGIVKSGAYGHAERNNSFRVASSVVSSLATQGHSGLGGSTMELTPMDITAIELEHSVSNFGPVTPTTTTEGQVNDLATVGSHIDKEDVSQVPHTFWTTTYFPHPIIFNDPSTSCFFCSDKFFPLMGYGEVNVELLSTDPAKPNTEVSGGHTPHPGPTLMCVGCTTARMKIVLCEGHEVMDIQGGMTHEQAQVADYLKYLDLGNTFPTPFEWCSICVFPAKVGCCTERGQDSEGKTMAGCGLLLCEACEQDFKVQFNGNFEQFYADSVLRRANGTLWARADLDFLAFRGHLMARLFPWLVGGATTPF